MVLMMKVKETTKKVTLSAMFVAIGLVLPLFTGQIPAVGSMLLPMHIPVFLCGLICGWQCGLIVGFILPLMRSVIFGMPPFFPTAIAMAFELATYGFVAGFLYGHSRWKCVVALYRSILVAMVSGRAVWGIAQIILLGISGGQFTWQMFMAGAFLNAIPGIVLQLVLLPAVMVALNRTGLVPFHKEKTASETAGN
ncbi:MAG: ECF transporter S component [Blautia sp.]|nr:ECF transporter S component [Lachnoclostridium sp.]MCM1212610.1 ECF transporter S component [Blautia sp.]